MLVAATFQKLIANIQPRPGELQQADSHANSIKQRLQSSFQLKNFLIVGSHDRRTAIRETSDLDVLALLSRDEVRWGGRLVNSKTTLDRIHRDLSDRFKLTSIGRNGQVIRVDFGKGDYAVDVIPAYYVEQHSQGWPIFGIPDGAGGWIRTAPTLHSKYLSNANEIARGKLRTMSQLLKFWTQTRTASAAISSFHLEMLLASKNLCVGAYSYSTLLAISFFELASRQCAALRDPVEVAGLITCAGTEGKRTLVHATVATAAMHARAALDAERRGNEQEAYRQWDIAFNHTLPT